MWLVRLEIRSGALADQRHLIRVLPVAVLARCISAIILGRAPLVRLIQNVRAGEVHVYGLGVTAVLMESREA